jgi:eukaryotic-like serine/threonine-protein kinase
MLPFLRDADGGGRMALSAAAFRRRERVGRYEVVTRLARGGMAQIYLARRIEYAVLKTILYEHATDQRFITMFLDEARLAATLDHPNIAQIYEVDEVDGMYFMAMEYIHGENVRAILETTRRRGLTIPLELAVMIIRSAAAGLHYAHERRAHDGQPLNIVHRDVSPANIVVGFDGSVKLLDFGIAKSNGRATETIAGTIKGKFGYMSPEQCKGEPIDRRSDIFTLGICLYELTTLRRAFKGDDFETMKRIAGGDFIVPSNIVSGYPPQLEAIVLTAMANDVDARFQTAHEMLEALDAFALRAKLIGSATGLGRFLVQLFGARREPEGEVALGIQHARITDERPDTEQENTRAINLRQTRDQIRTAPSVDPIAAPAEISGRQPDDDAQPVQPAPSMQREPVADVVLPLETPSTSTRLGSMGTDFETGAVPLVDVTLGWRTPSSNPLFMQATAVKGETRLPARLVDTERLVITRRGWIVLALLMLAGLGSGILIALQGYS